MSGGVVLLLGSAPQAVQVAGWPRPFDTLVAINNAWRLRPDWDVLIHPEDLPPDRLPQAPGPGQRIVTAAEYVPVQNRFGGFVLAGATMAFTAGYWALGALKPRVLAWFGCDLVYPATGPTHFYGTGQPDPLRADISLRNLEAKAARFLLLAAARGCACVNLSAGESRLVFPRSTLAALADERPLVPPDLAAPLATEARLGYHTPTGCYEHEAWRFDTAELDALDTTWLSLAKEMLR